VIGLCALKLLVQSLSDEERGRVGVLAGSYSRAAALNVLGAPTTPRAVLARHYGSCVEQARIVIPPARPGEDDLPVFVCRQPRGAMIDLWPEVRRYRHGPLEP
jgi:hypothetical protein